MVNESLVKCGQWVQKHLEIRARDAWLALPFLEKLLLCYEARRATPTYLCATVQDKNAVLKARIRDVQKYLAWDTENIRPDRLLRLNLAWQGLWARVPTMMLNASPWDSPPRPKLLRD